MTGCGDKHRNLCGANANESLHRQEPSPTLQKKTKRNGKKQKRPIHIRKLEGAQQRVPLQHSGRLPHRRITHQRTRLDFPPPHKGLDGKPMGGFHEGHAQGKKHPQESQEKFRRIKSTTFECQDPEYSSGFFYALPEFDRRPDPDFSFSPDPVKVRCRPPHFFPPDPEPLLFMSVEFPDPDLWNSTLKARAGSGSPESKS
jgi:hypothetical protein